MKFLLPNENFQENLDTVILPTLAPYCESFYYTGKDNAPMYGTLYRTPNASAVIVLCHGFCEYTKKYAEIIYNFFNMGYAVAICEHRGHGFSARQTENLAKVHIDDFNTYTADFNCFTAIVERKFDGLPLLLYGHSMGGCIAVRYLEQYPGHYTAAILTCPMLEIRPSGISARIALPYAKLLLKQGSPTDTLHEAIFNPMPNFEESSCTNAERFYAYFAQRLEEELYQTSHATVGWLVSALEGIELAIEHADMIHIPVLLCQAGKDNLVYPAGHERLMKSLENITLCRFPRAKHEITSADAATRSDFWKTIATFLKKQIV